MGVDAKTASRVARMREFNRFYTRTIGVLAEEYLHTRWNVTEARVIYELATRGPRYTTALRHELGLDSGYLSRILARFEADGLVELDRDPSDQRRQTVALTRLGKKEFARLDQRSAREITKLLSRRSDRTQQQLLAAMDAVTSALTSDDDARERHVTLRAPTAGEYGWVIERHGALYAQEYNWDVTFEALVARIVADYLAGRDDEREAVWIAELDGEPVGSIFCVKRDDTTAQLRLLLVEPHGRGTGAGAALVRACIDFARAAGYREIMLWTNDVLVDARRIYERAGFTLVEEEAHHSFGHDLVGQNWTLPLC